MSVSEQRLREFIEEDLLYQAYKKRKDEPNKGLERFHYVHCWDIENVLEENKRLKELNKELISVLQSVREDINFPELCDGYLVIDILDKAKNE